MYKGRELVLRNTNQRGIARTTSRKQISSRQIKHCFAELIQPAPVRESWCPIRKSHRELNYAAGGIKSCNDAQTKCMAEFGPRAERKPPSTQRPRPAA